MVNCASAAAAQKADINKQLLGIPGRIDEAQRAIPEETIDVAAIEAALKPFQVHVLAVELRPEVVFPAHGRRDAPVTRMREAFNIGKSNRLQSVNQQGQREASKEMIEGLQAQIAGLQTEFDAAEAELKNLTDEQASLQAKLVAPTPFEQTTEYASLAAAVAASKAAEAGAGQTTTTALEALNAPIPAVYAEGLNDLQSGIDASGVVGIPEGNHGARLIGHQDLAVILDTAVHLFQARPRRLGRARLPPPPWRP